MCVVRWRSSAGGSAGPSVRIRERDPAAGVFFAVSIPYH